MESNIKLFVALKAIIVNEGKVLIVREAGTYNEGTNIGKWGVPGGRLKPGEHFAAALKREVSEEVGLEVELLRPVHIDEWRPVVHNEPWQIVATFILCKPLSSTIRLSEEHDNYAWIDLQQAGSYELMPEDLKALILYYENPI